MRVLFAWNGPATAAEREPLARRQLPLMAALATQGVSSTVVLFGDAGGLRRDLANAAIDVRTVPAALPPNASAIPRLPAAIHAMRGAIREYAPDIVEGDEPMPAIAAGVAGRSCGRVVVYRRHHAGGRTRLLVASRLAAALADRTLVSNERMQRCASAQDGTPASRIDVASSGTPPYEAPTAENLRAARRELGIPVGAPVIVAVARLRREKGLDVLIAALDSLADIPGLHCVIVGSGPEAAELQRTADRSPVPVHLTGHRSDVATWLATASVVALPSRRESLGRVTLEAMAARRPLVASRTGGIPSAITHGENGLLVSSDDPRALSAAVRDVLTVAGLGDRLADSARRSYEARFTIDHMATAWREAWERAMAAERRQ